MARIKYSKAEKLAILHLYKDGHHSIADISAKFSVDPGTTREWNRKYEVNGEESLEEAASWNSYSKELKLAAVTDYLSGKYSLKLRGDHEGRSFCSLFPNPLQKLAPIMIKRINNTISKVKPPPNPKPPWDGPK
ncbi:transposase-like protein [Peribacillus huizhouensis]|uniref:Transposase-like protein n=1 Tax=Peribacillus huizhouensis TaxID=1501239 RepID=A0ABR6CSV3_9BACI|nr:transposase-like protein [Peribacillus huizhouensis]